MSMKIYFCGSIRGGQQDVDIYARIITELKTYGTVLTEHVGIRNVEQIESKGYSAKAIHDRDIDWLEESDVVVAEVTQISHGVGYEVGRAAAMGKKILLLFRPESGNKISAMIEGAANDKDIVFKNYTELNMPDILKKFLN